MTAVNLVGLTVTTVVLLLLGLLVLHEVTYDRPIPNSEQLVLIGSHGQRSNGQEYRWPIISAPVPVDLADQIAGIDSYVRLNGNWEREEALTRPEIQITTKGVFSADSSFFEVTGVQLSQGDPRTALVQSGSAVITRALSRQMFGDSDPMGESFMYRGNTPVTVTGVIEEMPAPSMLADISMLVSWTTIPRREIRRWNNQINYYCLVKLQEGVTVSSIRQAVDDATDRHFGEDGLGPGYTFTITLTPLRRVHLFGDYDPFPIQAGRLGFVLQFVAIGLFLLLIATLNFINLTTAQSLRRGLYVGVSKTLGASRSILMRQFITETLMLVLLSVLSGTLIAAALMPAFSNLVDVEVGRVVHGFGLLLAISLLVGAVYGLFLGVVPAWLLSGVNPLRGMKGTIKSGRGGARLRGSLVMLQFAVATGLIISSMVVLRQIKYIRTADIGYNRENVLAVRLGNWDLMTSYQAIFNQYKNHPYIINASTADHLPIQSGNTSSFHLPGAPEEERVYLSERCVDHNYLETLGMHLISGRNFDPERSLDSTQAVIVNEAAAKALGFVGDPVGQTFESIYDYSTQTPIDAEIIGVVENYQSRSMRDGIDPLFLRIYAGFPPWMIFRLQSGSEAQAISDIEALWAEFAPGVPVQYSFLDERFDALYRNEARLSALFRLFTGVSIIVAGLGLFALSAFVAERRTKEIGVRKVLGARIPQIVSMLVSEFLRLVIIANLVAWPVSWWLMNKWLQGYAFRTNVSWHLFATTFALSVVIALVTVSIHAVRASLTNPVNALRDE